MRVYFQMYACIHARRATCRSTSWIAPNTKHSSPAVAAVLGKNPRDPSPSHAVTRAGSGGGGRGSGDGSGSGGRGRMKDVKFARMAAGLSANPGSGAESSETPEMILKSIVGCSQAVSPGNDKGSAPVKGSTSAWRQPQALAARQGSRSPQKNKENHHPGAPRQVKTAMSPAQTRPEETRRVRAAVGDAAAHDLNQKIERLYECHVRGMDVIAQQQAQISLLHKDLRIMKSAVTYLNAKVGASEPQDAHADPAARSTHEEQTALVCAQLQESVADLVEARGALVVAMQWADRAQEVRHDQDFRTFRHQLETCGLFPAKGAAIASDISGLFPAKGAAIASGVGGEAISSPHAGTDHQGQRANAQGREWGQGVLEAQRAHEQQSQKEVQRSPDRSAARPQPAAPTVQTGMGVAVAGAGEGGVPWTDVPGPQGRADKTAGSGHRDAVVASPSGQTSLDPAAVQRPGKAQAEHQTKAVAVDFARPPSPALGLGSTMNSGPRQTLDRAVPKHSATLLRSDSEAHAVGGAVGSGEGPTTDAETKKPEGEPGESKPDEAGGHGPTTRPGYKNDGSDAVGGSGGGVVDGAGEVLGEDLDQMMEECGEEAADELVTTRLALRNMVKLSRMPSRSEEKIKEYRRLLEECAVMSEYQLPEALCQRPGGHTSPRLEEVLDAVRDLNLAKTALRKMMALLEDPGVESEVFVCARVRMCARACVRVRMHACTRVHICSIYASCTIVTQVLARYASVIEETLLAQHPDVVGEGAQV